MFSSPAALAREIHEIIHHERAAEIFANGWLHDGQIPCPSVGAMCFFAGRFLRGQGLKEQVGSTGEFGGDAIQAAIDQMKSEDELGLTTSIIETKSAEFEAQRFHLSGIRADPTENHKHEWWDIVDRFLLPDPKENTVVQAGERIVARKCLEALMLRAAFTSDVKRIRALADVMELLSGQSRLKISNAQRIAALVRREFGPLNHRLGRPPSKSEIKEFLLGVADDLSDDGNAWAQAFKMLAWPEDDDRRGRKDGDMISKLITEVRRRQAPE